ncbi:hypothetical protein [Brucella anthropi]|uniref:hypothetical protein n=1 Tax=Brucella anthropi TaxID=529 RepID=UPI001184917B|nr:hypothetical protein [Brucella anthropi]
MSIAENFIQICLGLAIGAMFATGIVLHLMVRRMALIEQSMTGTLMALVSEYRRTIEISNDLRGATSEPISSKLDHP